jgi:outer membrane protein OmpA-like peptidoglycan-associated protein
MQSRVRPPLNHKEQIMKTAIIALAATSLVATTSWAGPKGSGAWNKEEGIGVGTGATIGAIAGGPVGLAIGIMFGGWLGNTFHDQRTEKEELAARVAEKEKLTESLEELLAGNETELEQMRLVMVEQEDVYRDALQQALDIEVYFHTGESELDAQVAERVRKLGRLMRKFDGYSIVVEGHADPRGEDDYNDELSAARAQSVRAALIGAGLEPGQILVRAEGERGSQASDGDLDAMALERRVDLSIVTSMPRENRVAQQ